MEYWLPKRVLTREEAIREQERRVESYKRLELPVSSVNYEIQVLEAMR